MPCNLAVTMTVDEFECIRLIDLEKKTQEECASLMNVARTTAQAIYDSARSKIADSLVNRRVLRVEGGNYELCSKNAESCCAGCARHSERKSGDYMKIAVTYENGSVFQHFGHTGQFKVYDVEGNKITQSVVVDTNGSGHGALAGFLKERGVDTLICGGIGGGARSALNEVGIKIFGGVTGSADNAVTALIAGNLEFNPNAVCTHHGEGHAEGAHTCGSHEHTNGEHTCGNHSEHTCSNH